MENNVGEGIPVNVMRWWARVDATRAKLVRPALVRLSWAATKFAKPMGTGWPRQTNAGVGLKRRWGAESMSVGIVTTVVAQSGTADHRTIANAVASAPAGGRVLVRPGTYEEQVLIDRDLELVADGASGSVRIVAPGTCVTVVQGSVSLRGLTLWQGQPSQPKPGVFGRLASRAPAPEPVPAGDELKTAAVELRAGLLRLDDCSISAASGCAIMTGRPNTRVEVRRTQVHRVTEGIAIVGGATGLIEDCQFSEWVRDAVWVSRPSSRLEIRRCTFRESQGQPIYVDKSGTALIETAISRTHGSASLWPTRGRRPSFGGARSEGARPRD